MNWTQILLCLYPSLKMICVRCNENKTWTQIFGIHVNRTQKAVRIGRLRMGICVQM
jgi:hypothetical protein